MRTQWEHDRDLDRIEAAGDAANEAAYLRFMDRMAGLERRGLLHEADETARRSYAANVALLLPSPAS